MSNKILFGFHAVTVRLKTAPKSVSEIHFDAGRRDQRMRQFLERAREAGVRLIDSDDDRLQKLCGSPRHQGVAARAEATAMSHSLDDTLDAADGVPLLLVLDGITDPHNLGACLRLPTAQARTPWSHRRTMPWASTPPWPRWLPARPRRCPISWSRTSRAR